jgi:hypothetical protein
VNEATIRRLDALVKKSETPAESLRERLNQLYESECLTLIGKNNEQDAADISRLIRLSYLSFLQNLGCSQIDCQLIKLEFD